MHCGFATVSTTDTGHINSTVEDLSWTSSSPEKQTDWGLCGFHGSVIIGK